MKIFKIQIPSCIEEMNAIYPKFKEASNNLIFIKEEHQGNGWYKIYFTGKNPMYDGMRDWYKLIDEVREINCGCIQEVGHVMWGI